MQTSRPTPMIARVALGILVVAVSASVLVGGTPFDATPVLAQVSSPSPTPSATPTPSTSPSPPAPRAITLVASRSIVPAGTTVTLAGDLVSTDDACTQQDFVQIQRRGFAQQRFRDLRSTLTDSDGAFRVHVSISRNSVFRAIAPENDDCLRAVSDNVLVRARVRISLFASDNPVDQGTFFTLSGRVQPGHRGTTLQLLRKRAGRFVVIESLPLGRRSSYSFTLAAGWEGERTFRTRWRAQDRDHETNVSRALTITSR